MTETTRTVSQSLRERMADAVRNEWPDVGSFKVLDVVEARHGHEVLLSHESGTIQWVYVDAGYNLDLNQEAS